MARTIQEIITSMGALPAEISDTPNSEISLWRNMAARGIQMFEYIMDLLNVEISDKLNTKQYGTVQWYIDKAYEFQFNYSLQVNDDGTISYPQTDDSAKIISRCAVLEDERRVYIKVAKTLNGTLSPLDASEQTQFTQYFNAIRPAGIKTGIISEAADKIYLTADIYADKLYTAADVEAALAAALNLFKDSFEFNGVLNISDVYNVLADLQEAEAVVINELKWKPDYDTGNPQAINRRQLVSGYFVYENIDVRILDSKGTLLKTVTEI